MLTVHHDGSASVPIWGDIRIADSQIDGVGKLSSQIDGGARSGKIQVGGDCNGSKSG